MTNSNPPGVLLHFEWMDSLQQLSHEQLGRLFLAILTYGKTGVVPEWDDRFLLFVWNVLRPRLDLDRERYAAIVEKRRAAANKRWNSQSDSAPSRAEPQRVEPKYEPQRSYTPRAASSRTFGMPGSILAPTPEDRMNRYL